MEISFEQIIFGEIIFNNEIEFVQKILNFKRLKNNKNMTNFDQPGVPDNRNYF